MSEVKDTIIIGGGPAGLTAGIYAKRAGLDALILEKGIPGGQINITDEIENYPGFLKITGPELAKKIKEQALHFGAEIKEAEVTKIVPKEEIFEVQTQKESFETKTVIIASGANHRKLGVPGEAEFTGRGVSYCAVCDGAFFQDEVIAVVGGGNTAVEEAIYLTQFAKKVYIIHRRDKFRADKILADRALSNPKIEPVWNCVVEKIEGTDMVEKLILYDKKENKHKELEVAGVFIFIGLTPNSDFVKDLVETDQNGYIITDEEMKTSVKGVFAAGDVREKSLRQVVTAAADGAIAAMSVYHHLNEY